MDTAHVISSYLRLDLIEMYLLIKQRQKYSSVLIGLTILATFFAFSVAIFFFFFNWDSLHARLNSHYKAWSYKKKKYKKIKAHRKSVYKEPTVKRCLLILDLKLFRSQVKGKYSIGRKFQSLAV